MPHVDFLITNPKHHIEAALPVIKKLAVPSYGYRCRVVSLCEFRGFPTPTDRFAAANIPVVRVVPFQFRSPSASLPGGRDGREGWLPSLVRTLVWKLLALRLYQLFKTHRPDLVVLPNDSAYPNNRICMLLHSLGIPFMLMQEGIRFPLPGVEQADAYGRGGAVAVAAWGAASAAYFKTQGVAETNIKRTGSPRFDSLRAVDWHAEAATLKAELGWKRPVLLLLSNPIDDQGFCTTQEKLDLVARFIEAAAPVLDAHGLDLAIKLHPRESVERFQDVADRVAGGPNIYILQQVSLYALFPLAKAAVVMASTTGLEALMMEVPLGVLEMPGTGFVYDYVSSGAAMGLRLDEQMPGQLATLLQQEGTNGQAKAYLAYNFSHLGQSAEAVCDVIRQIIAPTP